MGRMGALLLLAIWEDDDCGQYDLRWHEGWTTMQRY